MSLGGVDKSSAAEFTARWTLVQHLPDVSFGHGTVTCGPSEDGGECCPACWLAGAAVEHNMTMIIDQALGDDYDQAIKFRLGVGRRQSSLVLIDVGFFVFFLLPA